MGPGSSEDSWRRQGQGPVSGGGGLAPHFVLCCGNKHSVGRNLGETRRASERKTASEGPLARTRHGRATLWTRAGLTSQSSRFCRATNRQPVT